MSAPTRGSILAAWEAAVAVTAAAYECSADLLRAASRGRGPRPPAELWEPRKMAVHLAIVLAECSYAALGRAIGLHRDTVASHCAEMRDHLLEQERGETLSAVLEKLARARLAGARSAQIEAMRAHLAMLEETAGDLAAPAGIAHSSDGFPTKSPTVLRLDTADHGNVILVTGPRPS